MAKKMMKAYYIMLSNHMWEDENTTFETVYPLNPYTEEIRFDEAVWDEVVRYLAALKYTHLVIDLGDGVKYASHPEIAAPNAWTREHLVQKLDELRAMGITPIPKMNFSACHDTWLKEYRRMISTPAYYRVCADLIAEVCELFGHPEFFHLGMDEENEANQRNYEMIIIRNPKLLAHDLTFLFDQCRRHGARPWIWADYCWANPDFFLNNVPHDVLLSNWYYGHFRKDEFMEGTAAYTYMHTYDRLDELGFEQVPTCSTWSTVNNPDQTVHYCRDRLSPEKLVGFMTAPWFTTVEEDRLSLLGDAKRLDAAIKLYYGEAQ